jgi:hypothetical protein
MRRSISHYLIVPAMFALVSAACGDNLTTTPTDTSTTTLTDTFSGTITRNGAATHTFNVARSGAVTATLSTLGPDNTVTIGLSLGTWNGESCQVVIARDTAVMGNTIVGTASAAGTFCLRVYDAADKLREPTSYEVAVVHPG